MQINRIFPVLILLVLVSCERSTNIGISGKLENGSGKMIYLDRLEVGGPVPMDSARIKSGNRFSFKTGISVPSFFRLRIDDNNFITLLAEPGENIRVAADASNMPDSYTVEGSDGSNLLKILNDRLIATKRQIDPLVREIVELEEGPGFEEESARINEEIEEIINVHRRFSVTFILDNIESMAAITALYQQLDNDFYILGRVRDIQYMKIVAESLGSKYPDSPHVRALAADADNHVRQYELYRITAMAEERGEVVTNYPDIAMPGLDGEIIRLKSLPERYVLVLFGSSLNDASVEFAHELLPVYRTYRNRGFQVYHISVERDRDEWRNYIRFSELPWIHVGEFGEGDFQAAVSYNVQQIPSNYLIHREAGIIARNISAPELRRRLARALD